MKEQLVYLPSSMYIPAPIQQQLAAYQTGELLEVYKFGWRGDKCPTTTVLGCLLVVILTGIVSTMSLESMLANGLVQTGDIVLTGGMPALLGALPFICLLVAIQFVVGLFKGSICVCAYSNGLIYAKNTHVIWLPWSECAYLKQKTKMLIEANGPGKRRLFTLQTHDGRSFRFGGPVLAIDNLGKILGEKIAHQRSS